VDKSSSLLVILLYIFADWVAFGSDDILNEIQSRLPNPDADVCKVVHEPGIEADERLAGVVSEREVGG